MFPLSSKAVSYTHEQVVEMMEFLIEYGPLRLYWEPAEVFHRLSCVQLLLQLISIACNWKTYYGRYRPCQTASSCTTETHCSLLCFPPVCTLLEPLCI